MASCKGVCWKYKVNTYNANGSMYLRGFIRCNQCVVWIDPRDATKGSIGQKLCPCCNGQLRLSRRNGKSKTLQEITN